MTTTDPATYYAVHDPSNPSRITYWRETARGRSPWPTKARYAPELDRRDVPAGLTRHEQRAWVNIWHRQQIPSWYAAVDALIDADRLEAQSRFAAFTSRCCRCSRLLTDPASKCYGIGPECRAGVPASVLSGLADAMGRAHAEAEQAHAEAHA